MGKIEEDLSIACQRYTIHHDHTEDKHTRKERQPKTAEANNRSLKVTQTATQNVHRTPYKKGWQRRRRESNIIASQRRSISGLLVRRILTCPSVLLRYLPRRLIALRGRRRMCLLRRRRIHGALRRRRVCWWWRPLLRSGSQVLFLKFVIRRSILFCDGFLVASAHDDDDDEGDNDDNNHRDDDCSYHPFGDFDCFCFLRF